MVKIININTKKEINLNEHGIYLIKSEEVKTKKSDFTITLEVDHLKWAQHLESCKKCKIFFNSFLTKSKEWIIEIDYIKYFINLEKHYSSFYNMGIGNRISYRFFCNKIKIDNEESNKETLLLLLKTAEKNEDYEECIKLNLALKAIKN
jgi:hypothetical protein